MAFIRAELKQSAKNQLSGRWGTAIGAMVLTYLVVGLTTAIFSMLSNYGVDYGNGTAVTVGSLGTLAVCILALPLSLGIAQFLLGIARREEVTVTSPFWGYCRFAPAVLLGILYTVFLTLWSLLLVIPGIIKTYSYAMSYYILADDENIAPLDAITKSREMMNGHKWELFVLQLSFILWGLLCVVTFGLAGFYVGPYQMVTMTNFYEKLKAEYEGIDPQVEAQAERAAEEILMASVAQEAPAEEKETAEKTNEDA